MLPQLMSMAIYSKITPGGSLDLVPAHKLKCMSAFSLGVHYLMYCFFFSIFPSVFFLSFLHTLPLCLSSGLSIFFLPFLIYLLCLSQQLACFLVSPLKIGAGRGIQKREINSPLMKTNRLGLHVGTVRCVGDWLN